jgi:hypothetical protein
MIKELDGKLKAGPEWRMEVTDQSGAVAYAMSDLSPECAPKRTSADQL